MANKKIIEVDSSETFDNVFVNNGGTLKQVSKESFKVEVRDDDHINSLIDAKLGVIENGTY